MPSPLYSGAAAFMMSAYIERDDLGWDFFEKMQQNGLTAVRGNGAVLKSVASGENAYGIMVDFLAMNAKKDGSPIDFVFPEEGVTAVTEPVAITSTAKNVEDARKFVDFILSDEGQKLALSQGYLPARTSVGKPDWLPEGISITLMDVDIAAVVGKIGDNKKNFANALRRLGKHSPKLAMVRAGRHIMAAPERRQFPKTKRSSACPTLLSHCLMRQRKQHLPG